GPLGLLPVGFARTHIVILVRNDLAEGAVLAVDHQVGLVLLGQVARGVDGFFLRGVDGLGVVLALPLDRPAVVVGHHVNAFIGHCSSLPWAQLRPPGGRRLQRADASRVPTRREAVFPAETLPRGKARSRREETALPPRRWTRG